MPKFNSKTATAAAKKKAASEKGGSRRAFWRKVEAAARWVLEHPVKAKPPSEIHRTLQQVKKKDPMAFWDRVFKQLAPKGESGPPDGGQGDGCADFLATVDQMLTEMEKCPSNAAPAASTCPSGPASPGPTPAPAGVMHRP